MKLPSRCWAAVCDVFTAVPATPASPRARPPTVLTPSDDGDGFVPRLSFHLLRQRGRLVAACLATVLGPAVVAQAGALSAPTAAEAPKGAAPTRAARVPVPVPGDAATWVPVANEAAATCPGLPSAILIAIGHVESQLGLLTGPSHAGAVGPMQFLPSTWSAYGTDGDGDGRVDATNAVDAVHGAARLLCANGGADPHRLPSALWNYNHSDDYVRQVMSLARFIFTES